MSAATPAPIVTRLSEDMIKTLASSDMRQRLSSQGIDPVAGGSEAFRSYVMAEVPKWARVIRDAKIPPQ
jgi:tripartite-type tricarboxylate transporter receptor subunit TctC